MRDSESDNLTVDVKKDDLPLAEDKSTETVVDSNQITSSEEEPYDPEVDDNKQEINSEEIEIEEETVGDSDEMTSPEADEAEQEVQDENEKRKK
eukprot:TRINITY_DN295_c0_g1_i1.p2 TRINITY_DN295_c0_g1~~TRINITY_DN295_c0_g1_i1.p2  ORF type:complete len:94 (+),score=32.03 TRINITY_DN295_c0_g1_i1:575-856(+)